MPTAGATREQIENSLQILGHLNQMLIVLMRYAVINQQREITGNVEQMLAGLAHSCKESVMGVSEQITCHKQELDRLNSLDHLIADEPPKGGE